MPTDTSGRPAPALPTADDVTAAADRIAGHVRHTPVLALEPGAVGVDHPVHAKLDLLQPTGSFKVRGAVNLLRSCDVPAAGVVAASGGNFGLAIAWAARRLGHQAVIFVPATSPRAKIDRLTDLGADVHVIDGYYADALAASDTFVAESGALRAHAYDQHAVVAGQGTCARELDDQVADLDTVLVAVGGGGLIAGVATWFGDRVTVVAVETEGTPALHAALDAGAPVDVTVGGLCASSLGARRAGDIAFAVARRHVDASLLVTDEDVAEAQRRLWEGARLVAEPGGATALAALTSGAYVPAPGERVAVILCGANTDPTQVV